MRYQNFLSAWGRILAGYLPVLSIEVTKECPLSCPGCYAYQPGHLAGQPLTSVSDLKGEALVNGILSLIDKHRPLGVFLVGGEPLVRFRELSLLLPRICERGIQVEIVTSAVRPIPLDWSQIAGLGIVVSVDGLQPEHDLRRRPATYARILKHIEGHRIFVHCTVTAQMMRRPHYLRDFVEFWSERAEVQSIRISFFTPQHGDSSDEILSAEMRREAVSELHLLHADFPKLRLTREIIEGFLNPPANPQECLFARNTVCVTADLKSKVVPCQFGGNPNCSECGCLASIALHSIGQRRFPTGFGPRVGTLYSLSDRIGSTVRTLRRLGNGNGS